MIYDHSLYMLDILGWFQFFFIISSIITNTMVHKSFVFAIVDFHRWDCSARVEIFVRSLIHVPLVLFGTDT